MNPFTGMSVEALTVEVEARRRALVASGTRRRRRVWRTTR